MRKGRRAIFEIHDADINLTVARMVLCIRLFSSPTFLRARHGPRRVLKTIGEESQEVFNATAQKRPRQHRKHESYVSIDGRGEETDRFEKC